ncbi:MAG: hypothetical protein ACREBC_34840 [Pyrinomonadaceae bacterium]
MVKEVEDEQKEKSETQPYRLRLPGFVSDEEIGFGDAMKRITSAVGIRPCGGCGRRAAALNRWFGFSGRRPRS